MQAIVIVLFVCDPLAKIFSDMPAPADAPGKIVLWCARNEYEAHRREYTKTIEEMRLTIERSVEEDDETWRAEQLKLAEEALAIVQRLDPPGVGARNLKECLLLQLTPGLLFYEELQVLISDHLEDLENNRLPQIARKTGFEVLEIEWIQDAFPGEL
jgi:hypothetical protein